jgi:hypothetical protein
MKKIIVNLCLVFTVTVCFSQKGERNGDIYIKHPYIDIVDKTNAAYLANDTSTNRTFYADTARFWVSGMTKPVSYSENLKHWAGDYAYYDSIRIVPNGYPDYLAYTKEDAKVVQSWGKWYGKSKKTGETLRVDYVQFDDFNKDGKIEFEMIFGDFSQMGKN